VLLKGIPKKDQAMGVVPRSLPSVQRRNVVGVLKRREGRARAQEEKLGLRGNFRRLSFSGLPQLGERRQKRVLDEDHSDDRGGEGKTVRMRVVPEGNVELTKERSELRAIKA